VDVCIDPTSDLPKRAEDLAVALVYSSTPAMAAATREEDGAE
jgi:hypothetical protein